MEIKECIDDEIKRLIGSDNKYFTHDKIYFYLDLISWGCFWKAPVTYYEHKTDSYKNNKKKLMKVCRNIGFILIPYKNGSSYGFMFKEGKELTADVLNTYWKEIDRNVFFEKEITHIPV